MGTQKLLEPLGETTLLARAFEAACEFPTVAVVVPSLVPRIPARSDLTIVVNRNPERGMVHSLRLADAAIDDREAALIVLLADMPYVDSALVARIIDARCDADVAYPIRAGIGGHPVVFGARPRAEIARLADGESLRALRDDPRWRRIEVALDDDAPYLDIDTPADLARARRSLVGSRLDPIRTEAKP